LSCTVQVANHRKAIGPLYAGLQTAANAGVPEDQAGLAAALITASFQPLTLKMILQLSGVNEAEFTVLDARHVTRAWLNDVLASEPLSGKRGCAADHRRAPGTTCQTAASICSAACTSR
jgi:hypothetical protein